MDFSSIASAVLDVQINLVALFIPVISLVVFLISIYYIRSLIQSIGGHSDKRPLPGIDSDQYRREWEEFYASRSDD